MCDRPLRGGEFGAANVAEGSVAASRFADGAAGLRSFELDCQAADIRENRGTAMS